MASAEAGKTEEAKASGSGSSSSCTACSVVDMCLRVLLFAATLTSVVVMVTSKQTERVPVPGTSFLVSRPAKFNHSPALIYFVAALAVACFYSIITALVSISNTMKPCVTKQLLAYLALLDVVVLGLVASATGAGGSVAYVGLKGNSHVRWGKICNVYDKFCRHVASSLALALFAAVILIILAKISIFSLYKKIRD